MGYDSETLTKALEQIQANGRRRSLRYENLLQQARAKQPRLLELENAMMRIGPQLGVAALSGDKQGLEALKARCEVLKTEKAALLKKLNITAYEPVCKSCKDTGRLPNGRLCGCVYRLAHQLAYEALCGEMPMGNSDFANFNLTYYKRSSDPQAYKIMEKNLTFCQKYAAEFSKNSASLLFMGGTGLGKTHLTLSVAKAVLARGFGVYYAPAQELIQALENEHFSYSESTPFLNKVLQCDLLLIDDLGTEFVTAFSQSQIYNIINSRLLKGLPTVINTNLTLAELEKKYSPRVTSRILGNYNIRKFCGSDVRQLKRLDEVGAKNSGTEKN